MNSAESRCQSRRRLPNPRSERGQVVLLVALASFTLVGVASLAIDVSFMYDKRNRLHAAADAAAKSAALEVRRGNTSNLMAYAQREVTAHGFSNSVIQSVNCPPTSGSFTGGVCGTTSSYVEVIVQETTSTFFGRVLSFSSMTPGARSVAGATNSSNCLVALGTTGVGLNLSNNASLTASNCNVAVNSTGSPALNVSNNANLTASAIGVTGTVTIGNNGTVSPTAQTGVPPSSDPLEGLSAPTATSPCTTNSATPGQPYTLTNNVTATISAGTYCGINISNNVTLTLNPGVYIISGGSGASSPFGINIGNNSRINGTGGVMIYNPGGGEIFIGNNAQLNIVAPTTGTWAGIGIFQPSSNTRSLNVSNNARYTVSGVSYTPSAQFRVSNNAALDGACMVIVALSMDIANNGGTFASNCAAFGGNPLRTVGLAE